MNESINRKRKAEDDYDSLDDFKSPEVIKPVSKKPTMRLLPEKPKPKKKLVPKVKKISGSQPSIESSFFKAQSTKPSFICALCLKSFPDSDSKLVHSKSCAAKNKVSPQQLIKANELQELQNQQRMAIGLPAGPIQQSKNVKKKFNRKELMPYGDDDINFVLAMSESISEAQEKEEYESALAIAAECNPQVLEMSHSQQKKTLEGFGFMMKQTANVEKPKRKKLLGKTPLQIRTPKAREDMIISKIAEILVENQPATQEFTSRREESDVNLVNQRLQRIFKPGKQLWNAAKSREKRSFYYVNSLLPFFYPDKDETDEEENLSWEEDKSFLREVISSVQTVADQTEETEKVNEVSKLKEVDEKVDVSETDSEFSIKSALRWKELINCKKFSDTLIYTKNGKVIYAHSLILQIHCPKVKDYWRKNKDDFYEIEWRDMDFYSAVAFLEFIYCGRILDDKMFQSALLESALFEVEKLAEKLEFTDLFFYISKKKLEFENVGKKNCGTDVSIDKVLEETSRKPERKSMMNSTMKSTLLDSPDLFEGLEDSKHESMENFTETPKRSSSLRRHSSFPVDKGKDFIWNDRFLEIMKKDNAKNLSEIGSDDDLPIIKNPVNPFAIRKADESPSIWSRVDWGNEDTEKCDEKRRSALGEFEKKIREELIQKPIDKIVEISDDENEEFQDGINGIDGDVESNGEVEDFREEFNKLDESDDDVRFVEADADDKNSSGLIVEEFGTKTNSFSEVELNPSFTDEKEGKSSLDSSQDDFGKESSEIKTDSVELNPSLSFKDGENEKKSSSDSSHDDSDDSDLSIISRYRRLQKKNRIETLEELEGNQTDSDSEISKVNQQRMLEISTFDYYETHLLTQDEDSQNSPVKSSESSPSKSEKLCRNLDFDDEMKDLEFDTWDVDKFKEKRLSGESIDLTQLDDEECEKIEKVADPIISDDIFKLLEECKELKKKFAKPAEAIVSTSKSISDLNPVSNVTKLMRKSTSFQLRSVHDISSESEEENPRVSSVSPSKRKSDVRSLKVKSKSDSFTNHTSFDAEVCDKELNSKVVSRIYAYLQIPPGENPEVSLDVLPREDFNKMSQDELNQKLSEFGVRKQKKKNAVMILNRIYDEIYPLVPECLFREVKHEKSEVDDDDAVDQDDLDADKLVDLDEDSEKDSVSNLSIDSDCSEVDESDIDLAIMKGLFKQLLDTDKDIYYKTLMYESLPLETIHQKLCQIDIKCQLKTLVKYLNDECISYYIEFPKQWRQRSRNKRK